MKEYQRVLNQTENHFFLFGPRGSGKTTWLRQKYGNAVWVDLLDGSKYRMLLGRPERLQELLLANKQAKTFIIDEIQRIPELLFTVHKLIEEYKDIQFILTGSSARKLRKSGVDLLAGRAVVRHMHPFIACEMQDDFDLKKILKTGAIPLVWSSVNSEDTLKSYIELYLEQEIKAEGIVRNLDQFIRFLEAVTFSHGQVLNAADIARECEVKRNSVVGYLQILEDLLIAKQIPVFTKRAKRLLVQHNKFYLFDPGVFNELRPKGFIDRVEEIEGQALEGLVFLHLQAWIDYGLTKAKIFYWRTRAGSEVDFIVYGEDCFFAIEVKNSNPVRPEDLTALKSFKSDYPECTTLLLYRGQDRLKIQDILCLPIESFLKNLVPGFPIVAAEMP